MSLFVTWGDGQNLGNMYPCIYISVISEQKLTKANGRKKLSRKEKIIYTSADCFSSVK